MIGLLCINLHLNSPIHDIIASLSPTPAEGLTSHINESFAQNTSELILSALEEKKKRVLADDTILPSNKNKRL